MRSGCIDPHFLDLGTSWRWVVNFTRRPLYPRGKSPRYPLDRRLGGPQSRSGRFGEENISWPYRDLNSDPWVVQPVASRYADYAIPAPNYLPGRSKWSPTRRPQKLHVLPAWLTGTLKMEAVFSSEKTYQTIRYYIPEATDRHNYCCETLDFTIVTIRST
jgi:hypothetical protein